MSPPDAAKLLSLSTDATPEQLEARFLELRTKLEDKIAKAPTPGLKAKYRESLEEITNAFETLTLAADSSSLPVTSKQSPGAGAPSPRTASPVGSPLAGGPGSENSGLRSQVSGLPAAKRPKSGGKEFLLVAVIAAIVLVGGGWFVMKTRTENAEKERVAAEQKAEAGRQAEAKARAAELEKARQDQLATQVRTQLAEAKIAWEIAEREERDAERRLGELRSELRGLRDAKPETVAELTFRADSAQRYANWLRDYLLQHPLKLARAKVEELLQARVLGDITPAAEELQRILKGLQEDLAASRNGEGTFVLASNLPTLNWELRDSLGRVRRGRGPERVTGLAFATYELTYRAPAIVDEKKAVVVAPGRTSSLALDFEYRSLEVKNLPTDARITIAEQTPDLLPDGRIPVRGTAHLVAHRPGHLPATHLSESPNASVDFTWVPINPPAIVEAFLAGLPKHTPADRATLLSLLETSVQGTALISPERWLQIFKEAESALAGEADPVKRLGGYLTLAHELRDRDPAAATAAVELAGKAMAQLGVTQRRELKVGNLTTTAWRLAPAVGTKFFQSLEAALPPEASRLPVFAGYLRSGAWAQADQLEQAALADAATPALRERTATSFQNSRAQHTFVTTVIEPLRLALLKDDVAAFNRLASAGIPSTGLNLAALIRLLWNEGLYNQAVDLLALSNVEGLVNHMAGSCDLTGRLDLLERLVTSQRAPKDFNLGWLAWYYASAGNKAKTRAMLTLLRPEDEYTQLGLLGARATALELIGDRKAAIEVLDRAEKHSRFTAGTDLQTWELSGLLVTARRQGDADRERRIMERSQRPEELLAWTNLDAGDIAAAKAGVLRNDGAVDHRIAGAFKDFYEEWLSAAELKGKDLPFWARPGCAEGLMLAYLEQSKGRGRANANRFAVPHLQSVPPLMKKQEIFYFPTAASNRGIKTGKATVRVAVDAEGKPTAYTTVDATDPAFAEELIRCMSVSTFLPALKLGQPVAGNFDFIGTFDLKP